MNLFGFRRPARAGLAALENPDAAWVLRCRPFTPQPARDYDSGRRMAPLTAPGASMRRVGGVAAATAAALSLFVASAWAGGEPPRRDEPRFLLFSTTDLWRHGGFVHGGAVWSPGGVDKEGFALKVMFGGGNYRYISGALNNTEVSGRLLAATILPGYRFVRGKFIATIYGGLDCRTIACRRTTPRPDCVAAMSDFASTRSFGTSRRRPP